MRKYLAIVLLLMCCMTSVYAQVPGDVPTDHWAYEAINELSGRGYLLGYPDGLFHGERSMTRYELATVVKRILDGVNSRIDAVERVKSVPTTTTTPVTPPVTANTPEVTKRDLETVSKLVNEFKAELAVIGTRLDNIDETLAEIQSAMKTMDAILNDEEGALKTVVSDVSKLKKITLSGYVQSRYQTLNFDKEDESNDSYDTFLVRRARIKVTGKMGQHSGAVLQLDLGKNAVSVKDAYMTYVFGDSPDIAPTFQIGQQNWWFGYEAPYSSSRRETPERALFVRRFFPGERDQGAALIGPTNARLAWTLGVYNGTGVEKGQSSDLNNRKDVLARLQYRGGDWNLGVSGYYGTGVWKKFGEPATYLGGLDRNRYGADFQYYLNQATFKAEYIRAKGIDEAANTWDQSQWVDGYYAQINYNLTGKDTLVTRYSALASDPVRPQYGRRSAWEFGLLRWLDDKSRMKFFYKKNMEEKDPQQALWDNDGLVAEWVVSY